MRTIQVSALAVLFMVFPNLSFAQSSSALKDVRNVSVIVTTGDSEPNKYGLNPDDIKNRAIEDLSDAGFKSAPLSSSAVPDTLRIYLNILKIESCGQCVVSVQTSFLRWVSLPGDEQFFADVWRVESGLQAVKVDNVPAEINDIVQKQVQTFIAACPPKVSIEKKPDVNQTGTQSGKTTVDKDTKPVKKQDSEARFVASKNSHVFHRASCPFAQRISAKNLVSYATRDEAIAAGKRPCERCNP